MVSMAKSTRLVLFVVAAAWSTSPTAAHYNMLLPETASAKRGAAVTITYQWGHPFEHQLFNAPAPEKLFALSPGNWEWHLAPDGKKATALGADDKPVTVYRYQFKPQDRGDYRLILQTPPIWMEEEQVFFQDTVKVVLHVQAQRGWDARAYADFEMVPLTRPYGLEPGMAFQAQVVSNGKPLAGSMVEIEHYHPTPPKKLPPDEHMTRTAKTDPNGVVTCTLTEPGWWCITAQRDGGKREHDGKAYPVRERSTLWVWVDDRTDAKGK
jgi:cobalt/nickel transport protein